MARLGRRAAGGHAAAAPRFVFVLLAFAAVLAPSGARASAFNVRPTQVALSGRATSGLLTLKNESAETLRFQLSAFAWSQSPTGEVQVQPTQDVVVYPPLLSLAPGEERKIRVGATVPATAVERTYRVFVEELPPVTKAKDAKEGRTQVRVLTRMGIPIFLAPAGAEASAAGHIEPKLLRADKVAFEVKNTGNVHFQVRKARVLGLGAAKENLFERSVDGWYVLAGGTRVFEVQPPKGVCAKTKALAFEVTTDRETLRLQSQLDTRSGICGP
ncbi:MAG TPA: fimbria/pilus periplasmic chaperone [Polyangia bacterium]|nr:fimbria/pilus periplasmic chaperone [Polyangia bacterium]